MDFYFLSHLAILVALIFISMFFSAVETSLLSAPRGLIQQHLEKPGLLGRAFREWAEHPNRILTAILIGNNTTTILATILTAYSSVHMADENHWSQVATGTVTSIFITFIIIVFGEMIPKITARSNAAKSAVWLIVPIYLFDQLLRPLTVGMSKIIVFFIPSLANATISHVTEEDIKHMIEVGRQDGTIQETEQTMIHSVFKFSDTKVNEVMIPRTDMFCVDIKTELNILVDLAIQTGYSRMPVYKGSLDNIVGIIHTRDLLSIWRNQELIVVQDLVRKPYFIPETMRVDRLLQEFRRGKMHMAIIVDEYGGTSGLVTLEDLVEEIVGEIRDEYDMDEEKPILKQEDGSYLIEANVPLDEVNETLGVHLTPKGEVTSLGGYLTEKAGKVPKKGRVIDEYETTTTIIDADEKKIIKVKMVKKDVPYPPPPEEPKAPPKPRKKRAKPPAEEAAEVPKESGTP